MRLFRHMSSVRRSAVTVGLWLVLTSGISVAVMDPAESVVKKPVVKLMSLVANGDPDVHELDEDGIPALRFNRLGSDTFDNPVYIGIYGLWYYSEWLGTGENDNFLDYYTIFPSQATTSEGYATFFLNTADWYVQNIEVKEKGVRYGVWSYPFEWPIYELEPGWVSGMAQGLAMQVLVRAWMLTRDSTYLETAYLAMAALEVPVEQGGALIRDGADRYWYEEYASPDATLSRVLNGHAHALISLNEFAEVTGDSTAARLFSQGVEALAADIEVYDLGWWTAYDALGLLANAKYHAINYELVKELYAITGRAELGVYSRWEQYSPGYFKREFVRQKPNYIDVATVVVVFASVGFALAIGLFVVSRLVGRTA